MFTHWSPLHYHHTLFCFLNQLQFTMIPRHGNKKSWKEGNANVPHAVQSRGTGRWRELQAVVSKLVNAWGTPVPRSHRASDNTPVPDTSSLSQLYHQRLQLPRNNIHCCFVVVEISDWIAPAINTNVHFSFDVSPIMAGSEELEKQK